MIMDGKSLGTLKDIFKCQVGQISSFSPSKLQENKGDETLCHLSF